MSGNDDLTAARVRMLEEAGFPPDQAAKLVARNTAEVDTWPPLSEQQRKRLAALLDLAGADGGLA